MHNKIGIPAPTHYYVLVNDLVNDADTKESRIDIVEKI